MVVTKTPIRQSQDQLIALGITKAYSQRELGDEFQQLNEQLGTDFVVRRFRKPHREAGGEWNCQFQLPTLVTRYGEVEHEHGVPLRFMFDLRYMHAMLADNRFDSLTTLRMDLLDFADPQSPIALSVEKIYGVLSLEDVCEANLLVEEGDGAEFLPWLYAVVSPGGGLVYPMAHGTQMVARRYEGESSWKVQFHVVPIEPIRSTPLIYDRYDDDGAITDDEIKRLLDKDCALLRKMLDLRNTERYAPVKQAVRTLREQTAKEMKEVREYDAL